MRVYKDLMIVMRAGKNTCTCSNCEAHRLIESEKRDNMYTIARIIAVIVFLALFTAIWFEILR